MTKIIFDVQRDNGYGKKVYSTGMLNWIPGQQTTTSPLPQMNFALAGSPIEIEIPVSQDKAYWAVTEYVNNNGPMQTYQRFVTVPESSKPINYLDLEDVDPVTFFNSAENV